jgi:hypothetical protein
MSKTIDEFYKENEGKIGRDIEFPMPLYYHSLNDAFYNYFKTFRKYKESYDMITNFSVFKEKALTSNYSFILENSAMCMLGFHRFFELLLKDLLGRVEPDIAVKYPNTGFRKAFTLFQEKHKYYKNSKDAKYKIIDDFSFLITDDNLKLIADYRNRITHNGDTVPNIRFLDYLVTQIIVPLVIKIINEIQRINPDIKPHYYETWTGIKILEEIEKIKFEHSDFDDDQKHEELRWKIILLGHLKELGRARYNLEFTLPKNLSYYEPYYEWPIDRNVRFAESERTHKNFYKIASCPCCGFKTLIVYRKIEKYDWPNPDTVLDFAWCNCVTCTYSIKDNIVDPFYFRITKERLFPAEYYPNITPPS